MTLINKYQQQLKTIDENQNDLINTLIKWANINSGSYHFEGIDRYKKVLSEAFSKLLDDNDNIESINLPDFEMVDSHGEIINQSVSDGLLIKKRPHIKKRVLLCGHMDTVYPKLHPFQTCQFIDNNTLNGPGVADMKGGILSMLTALIALESHASAKKIGWDVYLAPDEEIGSQSSAHIFPQFANHQFGMIYEPSLPNGEFVGERKGSGNFSIVVKGKAAHAGREFYKGLNAIAKIAEIVSEMHQLNDPNHTTTLNIGTIQGGQALNVVPDLAIARFNIRIASNEDAEAILVKVDSILEKHTTEGYQIFRHGELSRPAKPMDDKQNQLFDAIKQINDELGLPTKVIATGGCCDGNNLKSLGLPNVDTLGVRGGNIHSDKEYMLVDSLCERAKLSALLLLNFADGNLLS